MVNKGVPKHLSNEDLVQILSLPEWKERKVCFANSGHVRQLIGVSDLCHLAARTTAELTELDQI